MSAETLSHLPRTEAPVPPRGLLPVMLAATFMTALDVFIVNVAIPSLQTGLRAGPAAVQWVVAAFSLALAVGLVPAGRLGDRCGRRRMFALGLALFSLASAGCGLAPSAGVLIAARVAQGLGGALMGTQVLAVLRTAYAGAAQARAFAMYALTMGVGGVLGQLIGGVLIRADLFGLGWRSCFLINVPVGVAALLLVPRAVPESRAPVRPRLDLGGSALLTAALLALVLPLIEGRGEGWPEWTWLSLAAAAALFGGFGVHQHRLGRRGGDPIVATALFRNRAFTVGVLAQLVFATGQGSYFLVLALYLQIGRGLTALASGLLFAVIGAGYLGASLAAGWFQARLGRQTIAVGALLLVLGHVLLWLAAGSPLGWLLPGLAVDGIGMGIAFAPIAGSVLSRVPAQLVGSASGVLATVMQVGGALGVALIGIVFYGALGHAHYTPAFRLSVLALAGAELLLAALVQFLPRAGRLTER
jgi:EmrB/QacA subfamily drug resistance transporter